MDEYSLGAYRLAIFGCGGTFMPVVTFERALGETAEGKRHLLLGNGFSIALFPDRFRYGSLLDEADFRDWPLARQAFDALGTVDFETVISALRQTSRLSPLFGTPLDQVAAMERNADALKELLVQAIAGAHPERPSDVTEQQYQSCRSFLRNFIGENRGAQRASVYTLNYDLLLYWTLLHDEEPGLVDALDALHHDDGFRAPDDDPDAEYVTWEAEGAADHQCVHFLHGALHLFDRGAELQKKCWRRGGQRALIEQIRGELDQNRFPLFVAEGRTGEKLARIRHSGYLQRSLKSFAGTCRAGSRVPTALFIFGHSLADNDQHVLNYVWKGKIPRLYVSLFGDPDSPENGFVRARALRLAELRDRRFPLAVSFYRAEDAAVWG